MKTHPLVRASLLAAAALLLSACDSLGPESIRDNEGSTLTTKPGEAIKESQLIGKWDSDGERTNTANGNSGVAAIPEDVYKDIMGKGWRFHAGGGLSIDQTIGSREGSWKLTPPANLAITDKGSTTLYEASFRDGFLYLKNKEGRYLVMERNKFFGF